jgi:F-type H+-transporting ATPase subunit b
VDHAYHGPYVLVNFAVLVWILDKLIFSKLRARTVERHEQIKSELDRATTARTEADALLSRFRERLEQLDAETEELKRAAREQAEIERKRIIEAAKAEAERIRAVASATADREAMARIHEIEAEAVARAVERAETILRERLSEADQGRLVDDYVAQVAKASMGGPQTRRPA